MKHCIIKMVTLVATAVILLFAGQLSAGQMDDSDTGKRNDSDYAIGAGDVLFISVWKDEALTRQAVVLPDGNITFPLVGKIKAAGKTVSVLNDELKEKISRFVPDPVLSLEVNQVNSMQIYVIGEVNHPGRFPISGNVNVLQALAMAGGFTPYAQRTRIKIFRQTESGTKIYQFSYDDVSKGEALEQNIQLMRQDVIVVR